MELVVDRFVVCADGEVVDLSTGDHVVLTVSMAGGASEHARWVARCDWFARLHHRFIAPLVDYGLLGEVRRFEAWGCGGVWTGARCEAERAASLSRSFLCASDLMDGRFELDAVRTLHGRAVVLPNATAGYERGDGTRERKPVELPPEAYGVVDVADRGVESIAETLSSTGDARSIAIGLCGSRGHGVEMAVRLLARAARLSGYVPVSVSTVDERILPLLDRRSLLLIARGDPAEAWRSLVELTVHSRKSHVLLLVGDCHAGHIPTIGLQGCKPRSLVEAVRPLPLDTAVGQRAVSAANRSRGMPEHFRELFWGVAHEGRNERQKLTRAAERPTPYGFEGSVTPSAGAPATSRPWPAPAELAALRCRMLEAVGQLAQGRHAPGERAIRQVVAALARRQDWRHAARGGLALARSLVTRGRLREVQTALAEARRCAQHARESDLLVDVAVVSGLAATDEIRLDDAETMLHAALMSSRGLGEKVAGRASALALARCLFWRGRFDESDRLLGSLASEDLPLPDAIRLAAGRSRAAVGLGDLPGAMTHAATATRLADQLNAPSGRALAACASAFAHLSVGDHAGVAADVTTCVESARLAHDPLLGLRAKLLAIESARRAGDRASAATIMRQIQRVVSSELPPIVRVRCALAADLLAGSSTDGVARQISATGLRALRLFSPAPVERATLLHTVDDLVEILRCCQTADDDVAVLSSLCQRLRARLGAAGVAFFTEERGAYVMLASDGARTEAAVAARVSGVGQTVAPHRMEERIEGGAPVRYGGRLIGALVARWSLGTATDPSGASMLLTTAAAAAAPALAGAINRRAERVAEGSSELLGASDAIGKVRQAVTRAAAAPFVVLIEGESGSGKELVARALHRSGPRRDRPYCTLNCAALPDDLVESELFGHARGAFTGAVAERPGVFEEAHTGTLFLDEVGELSLRAQAKVLRTIQENEIRRVGENVTRRVDVRLVVATNRSLQAEVSAGRFRLDLFYRLDVIRMIIPPLRERREDIAILAEHFWREATGRVGSKATLSTAAVAALARYDWPGNVRELQNVLAALAVRSPKRGVVPPTALPPNIAGVLPDRSWRLASARRTFEADFIRAALVRSGGHRGRAAEELGVTRQGLTKLMTRLGISDSL